MSEENVLKPTKYIFKAPDWKILISFSLILPLLFGIFFDFYHSLLIDALIVGFLLIGVQAVLAFFTLPMTRFCE
jgi:uncharacterized membrane protein YvlD (DUF360 family)